MKSANLVLFPNLLEFVFRFWQLLTTPGITRSAFCTFTLSLTSHQQETHLLPSKQQQEHLNHRSVFLRADNSPRIAVSPFSPSFAFTLFKRAIMSKIPYNRNKIKYIYEILNCHSVSFLIMNAFIHCGSHSGFPPSRHTICHYSSSLERGRINFLWVIFWHAIRISEVMVITLTYLEALGWMMSGLSQS